MSSNFKSIHDLGNCSEAMMPFRGTASDARKPHRISANTSCPNESEYSIKCLRSGRHTVDHCLPRFSELFRRFANAIEVLLLSLASCAYQHHRLYFLSISTPVHTIRLRVHRRVHRSRTGSWSNKLWCQFHVGDKAEQGLIRLSSVSINCSVSISNACSGSIKLAELSHQG